MLVEIANVSNLPLKFEIKFPNELDIELEQWADVGEPTELEIRQNSIIDQRIFEFEPRSGDLKPGETMILRLSYSYNCLDFGGEHMVPITMKLDKGKQLQLFLKGRTLPRGFARLFTPAVTHFFSPTRIGHEAPPIQTIQLRNPSDVDVEYRIDTTPLLELQTTHYDFPILRVGDPNLVDADHFMEGYIAAGSWISLPFVFQPLEIATYNVALDVQYRGANGEPCAVSTATTASTDSSGMAAEVAVTQLLLEGRGYDPSPKQQEETNDNEHLQELSAEERLAVAASNLATRPKAEDSAFVELDEFRKEAEEFNYPKVQTLLWPGVLARLSVDRIDYGCVPSGCVVYRSTVVRNLVSNGAEIEFEWDREHPLISSGVLKMYPAQGRIKPGSIAVCKMTLKPGYDSEIVDTDVSCRVALLADPNGGRRGGKRRRGSTAASRRSGVNGGGSVASSIEGGGRGVTASSHTSVVRRTTAASRGGRPEQQETGFGGGSIAGSTAGSTRQGGGRTGSAQSTTTEGGMNNSPSMLLFAHVKAHVMRPGKCEPRIENECKYRHLRRKLTVLFLLFTFFFKDVYRNVHKDERNAINKFYIPTKVTPTAAGGAGGAGGGAELERSLLNPEENTGTTEAQEAMKLLAKSVMEHLVDDIMDDPFVKHLVDDMPPSKTPFFVQLNEKVLAGGEYGNLGQAGEEGGSEGKDESTKTEDEEMNDVVGELGGGRRKMNADDQSTLLQQSETQELLSRIMENTFFNLISEVAHGEINLNVEPRRMVIPEEKTGREGSMAEL